MIVNFMYSRILIHFNDTSEGGQCLDWRVALVHLCYSSIPEAGNPLPKHVAV